MNLRFFLFVITLFATVSCKDASARKIQVVTPAEMQNNFRYENMQVIDVQPEAEYKKSHLINARNIIYDQNFRKKLETLDKSKPVAIYCTTGKVSPKAAEILKEAGFKQIYILEGGIKKWAEKETGDNK